MRPDTSAQVIMMADLVITTPLTSVMYASPPQIAAGWTASTYAMVINDLGFFIRTAQAELEEFLHQILLILSR